MAEPTTEHVESYVQGGLKAARRCSDCDVFSMGAGVSSNGSAYQWLDCAVGHYSAVPDEFCSARELLRRAATCDDFTRTPDTGEGG